MDVDADEVHQNFLKRGLQEIGDEDDIDFDREMDQRLDEINMNDEQKKQMFQNNLLFSVQGLGSIQNINGINFYYKDDKTETCVKELIKFIHQDDPDLPWTKYYLGQWKVLQKDIVQLFLTQPQDQQLSYYLLMLLVSMTEFPSKTCKLHASIVNNLREFKYCIINNNLLHILVIHLYDCLEMNPVQRVKAADRMIEMSFIFIRNLLQIPDLPDTQVASDEIQKNLHLNFLINFVKQNCDNALVYVTQDFNQSYMKNLNLIMLEIYYHLFASFDADWLMGTSDNDELEQLKKMIEKDQNLQIKQLSNLSSRHSKFGGFYEIRRNIRNNDIPVKTKQTLSSRKADVNPNAKQIVFNVNDILPDQRSLGVSQLDNQLKRPQPRKVLKSQYSIWKNQIQIDTNIIYNDPETGLIETTKSFRLLMRNFVDTFLDHGFNSLIESVFDDIYKESPKLEENDRIYYFVVVAQSLGFFRHKHLREKREYSVNQMRGKVKGGYGEQNQDPNIQSINYNNYNSQTVYLRTILVQQALQLTHFQLIYSRMLNEVTKVQQKYFSITNFYAAILTFLELLQILKEMAVDSEQNNRQNSGIILQNIFSHDITRVMRFGFSYCIPGILNDEVLQTLTEISSVFFDLLESHAKGKVLSAKTDKLIRQQNMKIEKSQQNQMREQEELAQFIEQDGQSDKENDDDDFNPNKPTALEGVQGENLINPNKKKGQNTENQESSDDDDDDDDLDDSPQYKERQYTIASEFAMIADYSVIDQIIYMIKDGQIYSNRQELNYAIYQYFKRVFDLLKAEWIFYQAQYLKVFHQILNDKELKRNTEMQNFLDILSQIVKSYMGAIKKNPFLIVESLFRFSDKKLKDDILNNYENMANDQDEIFKARRIENEQAEMDIDIQPIEQKWNEQQDRVLIQNYETFQQLDDFQDQLSRILSNMGINKSSSEIRQRIKTLQLEKGVQRAQRVIQELYHENQISFEKAFQMFLDEPNMCFVQSEQLLSFFVSIFMNYQEHLDYHSEEQLGVLTEIQDFAIVPLYVQDFDLLEAKEMHNILLSMEFQQPSQGEIYWRVPGYLSQADADSWIQQIQQTIYPPEDDGSDQEKEIVKQKNIESQEAEDPINENGGSKNEKKSIGLLREFQDDRMQILEEAENSSNNQFD